MSTEPAERPLARDARRGPATHTTTNRGCVGRDTVPPRHAQTRLRTPGSGCQAPPGGRAALASRSCQETAHPPPGLGLAQTRPVSDADGLSCGTKCTAPTELSSTSSAHRSVTPASSAPPEAGVPDTAHVGTAPPNPSHVSQAPQDNVPPEPGRTMRVVTLPTNCRSGPIGVDKDLPNATWPRNPAGDQPHTPRRIAAVPVLHLITFAAGHAVADHMR